MSLKIAKSADVAADIEPICGPLHGPARLVTPIGPLANHGCDQ
jgi:hypothetical protein